MQRRLGRLHRPQLRGHLAKSRARASGVCLGCTFARHDDGAGVDDVAHGLFRRQRFAGERCFIDAEIDGRDEPGIRREPRAGHQDQHISWHHRFGIHRDHLAGSPHPCLGRSDALQRGDGPFGAELVANLGGHQQQDHHEDGQRIAEPTPQAVEDTHHQQEQNHRLADFLGGDRPEAYRGQCEQAVRPEAGEAGLGFFRIESSGFFSRIHGLLLNGSGSWIMLLRDGISFSAAVQNVDWSRAETKDVESQ